jgi:acyl dehydratase
VAYRSVGRDTSGVTTPHAVHGPEELGGLVGRELQPSPWVDLPRERVIAFDEATADAPTANNLGGHLLEYLHGLQTLALVVPLWERTVAVHGFTPQLYGLNRVRFPAPVPVGSRVRGRYRVASFGPEDGAYRLVVDVALERDGGEKPVCVTELVFRMTPLAGGPVRR